MGKTHMAPAGVRPQIWGSEEKPLIYASEGQGDQTSDDKFESELKSSRCDVLASDLKAQWMSQVKEGRTWKDPFVVTEIREQWGGHIHTSAACGHII